MKAIKPTEESPLANVQSMMGKKVKIFMRDPETYEGILCGFDDFMNVLLEDATHIKHMPEGARRETKGMKKILLNGFLIKKEAEMLSLFYANFLESRYDNDFESLFKEFVPLILHGNQLIWPAPKVDDGMRVELPPIGKMDKITVDIDKSKNEKIIKLSEEFSIAPQLLLRLIMFTFLSKDESLSEKDAIICILEQYSVESLRSYLYPHVFVLRQNLAETLHSFSVKLIQTGPYEQNLRKQMLSHRSQWQETIVKCANSSLSDSERSLYLKALLNTIIALGTCDQSVLLNVIRISSRFKVFHDELPSPLHVKGLSDSASVVFAIAILCLFPCDSMLDETIAKERADQHDHSRMKSHDEEEEEESSSSESSINGQRKSILEEKEAKVLEERAKAGRSCAIAILTLLSDSSGSLYSSFSSNSTGHMLCNCLRIVSTTCEKNYSVSHRSIGGKRGRSSHSPPSSSSSTDESPISFEDSVHFDLLPFLSLFISSPYIILSLGDGYPANVHSLLTSPVQSLQGEDIEQCTSALSRSIAASMIVLLFKLRSLLPSSASYTASSSASSLSSSSSSSSTCGSAWSTVLFRVIVLSTGSVGSSIDELESLLGRTSSSSSSHTVEEEKEEGPRQQQQSGTHQLGTMIGCTKGLIVSDVLFPAAEYPFGMSCVNRIQHTLQFVMACVQNSSSSLESLYLCIKSLLPELCTVAYPGPSATSEGSDEMSVNVWLSTCMNMCSLLLNIGCRCVEGVKGLSSKSSSYPEHTNRTMDNRTMDGAAIVSSGAFGTPMNPGLIHQQPSSATTRSATRSGSARMSVDDLGPSDRYPSSCSSQPSTDTTDPLRFLSGFHTGVTAFEKYIEVFCSSMSVISSVLDVCSAKRYSSAVTQRFNPQSHSRKHDSGDSLVTPRDISSDILKLTGKMLIMARKELFEKGMRVSETEGRGRTRKRQRERRTTRTFIGGQQHSFTSSSSFKPFSSTVKRSFVSSMSGSTSSSEFDTPDPSLVSVFSLSSLCESSINSVRVIQNAMRNQNLLVSSEESSADIPGLFGSVSRVLCEILIHGIKNTLDLSDSSVLALNLSHLIQTFPSNVPIDYPLSVWTVLDSKHSFSSSYGLSQCVESLFSVVIECDRRIHSESCIELLDIVASEQSLLCINRLCQDELNIIKQSRAALSRKRKEERLSASSSSSSSSCSPPEHTAVDPVVDQRSTTPGVSDIHVGLVTSPGNIYRCLLFFLSNHNCAHLRILSQCCLSPVVRTGILKLFSLIVQYPLNNTCSSSPSTIGVTKMAKDESTVKWKNICSELFPSLVTGFSFSSNQSFFLSSSIYLIESLERVISANSKLSVSRLFPKILSTFEYLSNKQIAALMIPGDDSVLPILHHEQLASCTAQCGTLLVRTIRCEEDVKEVWNACEKVVKGFCKILKKPTLNLKRETLRDTHISSILQ
ncbi:hypothetical protein ADUPG1_007887, partial [Aduncisulcus paluster]